MKKADHISDELQKIAPKLSGLDRTNYYTVPEEYFAISAMQIIDLIEQPATQTILDISLLSRIEKKEMYEVPQGYFTSFSKGVINKIHKVEVEEELAYSAHLLTGIAKTESYKVPVDYFATFPEAITKLASYEERAHPATIERWTERWVTSIAAIFDFAFRPRYAFAMACVVGIVTCMTLVTNRSGSIEDKIFARMEQLPESEIHHYIAKHHDEFDEHLIMNHINNTEFTRIDKAADVKSGADEVSEELVD